MLKNLSFKANMSDINASLLKDQILNYKKLSKKKRENFKIYKEKFHF